MSLTIQAAIARLWTRKYIVEAQAIESTEFRDLCDLCAKIYCKKDSPFYVEDEFDRNACRIEIRNVFRSIGAPWFEGVVLSPDRAALLISAAYETPTETLLHLIPLDMADELPEIAFGPWSIRKYSAAEFSDLVALARLSRFGATKVPDIASLCQFTWLVFRQEISRRPTLRSKILLDTPEFDEIGRVRQRRYKFSDEIEKGLFVLVLYNWEDICGGKYWTWKPFEFPWVYTITNNFLFEPRDAPDARTLTWEMKATQTDEFFEVPLRNDLNENSLDKLQVFLQTRWLQVSTLLDNPSKEPGAFNPLIEHYFLRAYKEDDVDQLLWHIAAVDAAIGRNEKKSKEKLANRILRLTKDATLREDFLKNYERRSDYVHGGRIDDTNLWQSDLARTRRIARVVVNRVIELASEHPDWTRKQLVKYLDVK